jgi:hypothetical protein
MKPLAVQTILYVVLMVGVIVGSDLMFLRHDAMLRLFANIAIVAAFLAAYVLIFKPFK